MSGRMADDVPVPDERREAWPALVARMAAIGLLVAGVGVVLGRAVDPSVWGTAAGLRAAVGADRWYGPAVYVSVVVGAMFLPVPKVILLGLAGALFGPWYGFVYAWTGQVVGMTVLFLVARTGLRSITRRFVHQHVQLAQRLDRQVEVDGLRTVAMLRLLYFMGTPLSIALSTTRLRLRDFVAGTGLGVVPIVALAVASGDAVTSGATALGAATIGLGIVVVAAAGIVVRRRLGM